MAERDRLLLPRSYEAQRFLGDSLVPGAKGTFILPLICSSSPTCPLSSSTLLRKCMIMEQLGSRR